MNQHSLPINEIYVAERYRKDLGDIQSLSQSIQRYGLLQPIVISQSKQLIAGGRRLAACQLLQWTTIPVVYRETLSEDELAECEFEENHQRKQTTWQEDCIGIAKRHRKQTRNAALNGDNWSQRKTAEMFNISVGNVNYILRVADKLEEELKTDVKRFWNCDGITDAWRLIMRDEEDKAKAELARRLQEQANKEKQQTKELVQSFVEELDAAPKIEIVEEAGNNEAAHLDSLRWRAKDNYLQLNKEEARTLYLSNPLNPPDKFEEYYANKRALLTKHFTLSLTNNFHLGNSIEFMNSHPAEFDHIITDIPYGIDIDMLDQQNPHGGMNDIDTIKVEHDVDYNKQLIADFFPAAFRATKDRAFVITWCDQMLWQFMYDEATKAGFKVQRWPITWHKTHACMNQCAQFNFTKNTEIAIVCRKQGATLVKPMSSSIVAGSNDAMRKQIGHPFAKPFEVWQFLTDAVSIQGQHILEPFVGRGSGALSMLRMQRQVTGVELNLAHYNALLENLKQYYLTINPNYVFS